MTINYSPKPIDDYRWAASSAALRSSPEVWNLAWLSYAPEHGSKFNAYFSSMAVQTCRSWLLNGSHDILDTAPASFKVVGLMRLPPPAALKRLSEAPGLKELALYKLLGSDWLRVMELRAFEYREPHDPRFDSLIPSLHLAQAALSAI